MFIYKYIKIKLKFKNQMKYIYLILLISTSFLSYADYIESKHISINNNFINKEGVIVFKTIEDLEIKGIITKEKSIDAKKMYFYDSDYYYLKKDDLDKENNSYYEKNESKTSNFLKLFIITLTVIIGSVITVSIFFLRFIVKSIYGENK